MDRRSAARAWTWAGVILAGFGVAVWVRSARARLRRGERILVVGDSMAEALVPYLRQLARDDQHPFEGLFKRGTRIDYWRTRPELEQALAQRPNLAILVLGTNDQVGAHTNSAREAAELAARIEASGARVVWIGPPTLAQGNDLADQLKTVFGREYYDSRKLEIPRSADGLHPTVSGAAGWAAVVWEWLH